MPIGPTPSDADLQALLDAFLLLESSSEDHLNAVEDTMHLPADAPQECWRLVQLAAKMDLTAQQAAYFAAGPLEDLLGHHGEAFIDRLEVAARRQPNIRNFVACVWRGQMSDAIWDRVLALRETLGIQPL